MGTRPTLAIIGGTGALDSGLAMRWAAAGYPVIVGSRSAQKAQQAASRIRSEEGTEPARGGSNAAAAAAADIVILAIPFSNHDATLEEPKEGVAGKIVGDAVVPPVPPKVAQVQLPPQGSAGQIAHERIGGAARVVSAFQNIGAVKLQGDDPIECDVLVCGNDKQAHDVVNMLANAIGMRGIDAGPIVNAAAAEAMTSVLIGINKRYGVDGAGIRITGIPD